MEQLKQLVDNWVLLAQGIIGSVGALCFANVKSPCTTSDGISILTDSQRPHAHVSVSDDSLAAR
jgi:hypothetical protein